MSRKVHCIGRGGKKEGCGYAGKKGHSLCPKCGGMLLTADCIRAAAALVKTWEAQDREKQK